MTKKLPIDTGKTLLILAAIVQGVQYASAFGLVHNLIDGWGVFGGIIAGQVVVLSMAYAGSRIPRIKARKARQLAETFFYVMLVVSPLILTPVNWYSMDAGLKSAIGLYSWVLSGMIATMPELALVMVAFSVDGGLIKAPSETSTPDTKPKETKPKVVTYDVKDKRDLSDEMVSVLKNGHTVSELTKIFPAVTERTIRNWKKDLAKEG